MHLSRFNSSRLSGQREMLNEFLFQMSSYLFESQTSIIRSSKSEISSMTLKSPAQDNNSEIT